MNSSNNPRTRQGGALLAKVCSRVDFLDGIDEHEIRPPDFRWILDTAGGETRGSRDDAPTVKANLECFRAIAAKNGLPLVIQELAVIDDELLQLFIDPSSNRVEQMYPDKPAVPLGSPRFVSLLASYPSDGGDECLLRAWNRAIGSVVKLEQRAIVGEVGTYSAGFIWHKIAETDLTAAAQQTLAPDADSWIEPISVDSTNGDRTIVRLPTLYSLGRDTIKQIHDSYDPDRRLETTDPTRSRAIAVKFALHFLAAAAVECGQDRARQLLGSVLLLVPFTRPWLFGRVDVARRRELEERPGGAIFMLCSPTSLPPAELTDKLRAIANRVNWYFFRAALLEAQQQRYSTRENDLSAFNHLTSPPLRALANDTHAARVIAQERAPQETDLLLALQSAEQAAKRLEKIGEVARNAVMIRSKRLPPGRFDQVLTSNELCTTITTVSERAIANARQFGIRDKSRVQATNHVSHSIRWALSGDAVVRTSDMYLTLLFDEVMKNALEHGAFDAQNWTIDSTVFANGSDVLISVSNPIKDADSRAAVTDMFLTRRFYLGLTQIELLARAYDLLLPNFSVTDDSVVVTCVLAKSGRQDTLSQERG